MLRKWLCQADVTVQLLPRDPVLIKSGYATLDGPDMVPVSTTREGEQVFYFPGTSLKGALRSHFERIARTLHEGSVCIPYFDPRKARDLAPPVPSEAESFGCGFRGPGPNQTDTTARAYSESCAACRLFGSLRFGGRFSIGDAYPLPGKEPKKSQRNGVGIDRFTGGTVRGVLFDLVVLEGGVFEAHVRVVNYERWQLAALNFLLTDLQDEIITIGSGRSRGLGRVCGQVTRYVLSAIRPQKRLQGLAELVPATEAEEYGLHRWTTPAEVDLPAPKRRGLRLEYDLSADWQQRLDPLAGSLDAFLAWHGGPKGAPTGGASER
jgi:CRISPR-associated RAMP protein (TIGR02581 family)